MALLNLLALLLGKLMRRRHDFDDVRVVVVCKLMGLGSIVQLTPLLASLRAHYPAARIVMLTRPANADFCQRLAVIDEVRVLDDASPGSLCLSLWHVLRQCWREIPDLFVNLEVFSNTGALLTILSCARNRLGYYLHPRDMRAHGVYTHMVYFNRNAPIAEVYLQAARSLGIAALPATLVAPRVDEADRTSLQKIMRDGGMADPAAGYLVFNPNASELRRERRWPEASFATLITRLHHARPELALCIVGGPGEEAIGAEVARQTGLSGLCDLSGRLTPGELAALLQGARAFVTNDSGPMHLALALDTPTVALFGPVSPDHYGGTANNQRLINLSHRVYCSPCVHHFLEPPCHGDNQCMKLITVDEVWQAVETLLSGAAWTTDTRELHYQAPGVVFGVQHRKNRTE